MIERAGWVSGGFVGLGLFLVARDFLPNTLVKELFIGGVAAMGMVVTGWLVGLFRSTIRG